MVARSSDYYLTNRAWFRDVVGGRELVLCRVSALECLQLFNGYFGEKTIDVYARQKDEYENINYHIVDTFDSIDIIRFDNILCTSVNQTINDMLRDLDNIDEQPLVEALNEYYFDHGKSFDGLIIAPENRERFDAVKDWAIEYHMGGG